MSLVKWKNGIDRFPSMPDSMVNFFESDISDFMDHLGNTLPAVNILETNEDFRIEVSAPGMSKEDFDLTLQNGKMVLSAKQEKNAENQNGKYHQREFHYSHFQRTFYLPESVDTGKIDAQYKDGIVYITLPKKEEVKQLQTVRQIEIS